MTREEFSREIRSLIPESNEELTGVWVSWAEEMAKHSRDWLSDNAEEIGRGEDARIAAWHGPRSNVEGNLQEIHASLYNINQQYGKTICRQIYELAAIPCCLYPLEALNVAEYLRKGGSPDEIERRCIDGGNFEWDIPENLDLLTLTDTPALDAQTGGTLSAERKAYLFDGLLVNVLGLMSDNSWYDIFRGIGMTDDEMRSEGIDLPELKVTEYAVVQMAEYIAGQIRETKMQVTQNYISFDVNDLAVRFGFNLKSCNLAEDMFMNALADYSEIAEAEVFQGTLWVTPSELILEQIRSEPQPSMGM